MKTAKKTSSRLTDPQRWVDLYGDQLYRYAFARVQNSMLAEDLVQETFLAALHTEAGFEGRSSEKTWLTSILKHKIIDHLRKLNRQQPLGESQDHENQLDYFFFANGKWKDKPGEWNMAPDDILDNKRFWEIFSQCLSELSDRLRIAFTLREMDGLEGKEICEILGVSSSNYWTMMYRARMSLRLCLKTNWFGE